MPLDDVAAHRVARPERRLEVHARAVDEPTERRARQRLGHGMEAEAGAADRLRRQADAVDRDRATHIHERSGRRRLDLYLHAFVATRDGDDRSDLTHDAGEHGLRLPAETPST